jgi:phage portal protein BeeE
VAALIDRLVPVRADRSISLDEWASWFLPDGPLAVRTTYAREREELPDASFGSVVWATYLRNPIVFACLSLRARLFADIRFAWQQMRGGRPGALFGTPDLRILEEPEPGRTTGDLLAAAILDADLGGNAFLLRRGDRILRLRPDWVTIIWGSRRATVADLWDPEAVVVGYGYAPPEQEPTVYLPEEVAHFAPTKDPLARNRGLSLLTAGIREILADSAATTHKLRFFENAATPNLAIRFPPTMPLASAQQWIDLFEARQAGALNAWRTLYLGGGVEVEGVGLSFEAMQYTELQGEAETRIAALTGMHPVVAALSEGLQGASLNVGNFSSARRLVADATLRPLWRDIAGALGTIVPPLPGTRLWYDDRDVPFLRDDVSDRAKVVEAEARTIGELIRDGFTPASAIDAVVAGGDWTRLAHTGLTSVQLQPPLEAPAAYRARTDFWAAEGPLAALGRVPAGTELPPDHPLVGAYPSCFEPIDRRPQVVSRAEVLAARARLARAGRPAGIDAIARELGVSRETVRRRLAEP